MPVARQTAIVFTDLKPADGWAKNAINYVGATHDWMRDYVARPNGTYRFHPTSLESRIWLARALVKAFAPTETIDPSIEFLDLPNTSGLYPYANVAVKLGWMGINKNGGFKGGATVNLVYLHSVLIRVLGLQATADSIDALHMTNGTPFITPRHLGSTLLGMRLGFRYNNSNESMDVAPTTKLDRAQVAYSLFQAATLDPWIIPYLQAQYADMTLPNMVPVRKALVEWGLRYVGYPYVWGGEWGFNKPEPSALGGQPIPGFDCSGFAWWVLKSNDGGAWKVSPPRPYGAWNLPQRVAVDQAHGAPSIGYSKLKPGDLMFYDGEGNGFIDHVDIWIGNGWALDSSSSVGGVSVMWVADGWYRDHFMHGRKMI
jgi:NlpC/P60 family